MPNHWLHVYQKPKAGNGFISRKLAYGYQHRISAMGWFDTASCQIAVTQTEAENIYENWLANRVAVYVDNPKEPIWEGYVNRVTFAAGGVTFSRSLDQMYNQTKVTWTPTVSSVSAPVTTAFNQNLTSQGIYGIKVGAFEGYSERALAAANGRVNAIRDTILAFQAYPPTSVTLEPGGTVIVSLELAGFYHTLEWEPWQNLGGTVSASVNVTTVLAGIANTGVFFDDSDTSGVVTNASFTTPTYQDNGGTVWQKLQQITEAGDGTQKWIVGIAPTDPNKGTRRLYYKAADLTVKYTARIRDGLQPRKADGGLVRPWTLVPDGRIRINDVLTGWAGQGDDPRVTYLNAIQYDGESQQVRWQGADDATLDGVFQAKRYYKNNGSRFGPYIRNNT